MSSKRTMMIDGTLYTYVRAEMHYGYKHFIVTDPRGRQHTIRQWAKRPDLFGMESNGCAGREVLQMVNGKFVDRTAEFSAAKLVTWHSGGESHCRYMLNGVDLLAA